MNRLVVHLPLFESLPESLAGGAERLPPEMRMVLERGRRFECGESEALSTLLQTPPLPAPAVLSRLAGPCPLETDGGSWWLRFDAVRLVPDLTSVWLDRTMPLDFGADELRPLVTELQAMFEAEGLDWRPDHGDRFGLLALGEDPACSFAGPDAVHGKRLDDVLPTGPGAARWRRLINESQMIFHQFRPLSRADQQGAGLWFWGAGEMTGRAAARQSVRVVDSAGSARVRGLAKWLDALLADSTAGFDDVAESACLVHWPLQSVDIDAALSRLAEHWLAPARRAQRKGKPVEIFIVGSTGYWRLGRLGALAFWRRGAQGFDVSGDGG